MAAFELEYDAIDRLVSAMAEYDGKSGQIVNEVLHGEGAQEIKEQITALLPISGRSWRGKRAAAAVAMPGAFSQDNGTLSVTIAARGAYGYLYFPDDGSNTMRHAGGQHFMERGAEAAAETIIDRCISRLTEEF